MLKILIITNLYKNAQEPGKAAYHTQQFTALSKIADVRIVAPLPYFKYSCHKVPPKATLDGIPVYYPRYAVIPKIGRRTHAWSMSKSLQPVIRNIAQEFPFDVILASWVYPDGVAAQRLAAALQKPLVILALGSDINIHSQYAPRRALIRKALNACNRVVAVSRPLKDKIVAMGIDAKHIDVLCNGVDQKRFFPRDMTQTRQDLQLPTNAHLIVYIGNLLPIKGVDRLIEAASHLPKDVTIAIIGDGPMQTALQTKCQENRATCQIKFLARQPHDKIPLWMNAANILCLPSYNEGCPNVILEALACATPVVAFPVGGIPDMITNGKNGFLVEQNTAHNLGQTLNKALRHPWDQQHLNSTAPFSWEDNAKELLKIIITTQVK